MQWNRLWMTGCMALVLLLAGRVARAEPDDGSRHSRQRITLSSRHGLDETARRVEQLTRDMGGSILVRTQPAASAASGAPARVLVWGDEAGRTPALQAAGEPLPELPWQVLLTPRADGGTDVSLIDPTAVPLPQGVAPTWRAKLKLWPQALRQALS